MTSRVDEAYAPPPGRGSESSNLAAVNCSQRRRHERFLCIPAALSGVALLSGCDRTEVMRFGWPEGITPQAEQMRQLWTWSTVAALVVGVIVWALIFWCVVRYRKKGDELPTQTRFNAPIEVLYTVVPILIVLVLFYYTAVTQTYVDKQSANPDVTVDVVASKWNWEFQYPGQETTGPQSTTVSTVGSVDRIPVLVVPVNKVIRFIEKSTDVIHSFWVPELLFKRDVIPGRINSFQVTIDTPGAYVGRCAELCGTYHSSMNFELRAVSWDSYQRFLMAKKTGSSTPDALRAIGEEPYATTTRPFDTDRSRSNPV